MVSLYLNTESDSIYLDITGGDPAPATMATVAEDVFLHLDDARTVVGIEVLDVSQRGGGGLDEPGMGHLHVKPSTDSLYLDVSAGARPAVSTAAIADGVNVHVDGDGTLVGIEILRLTERGGLRVDDLDAAPDSARPAIFDEIERAAARPADGP